MAKFKLVAEPTFKCKVLIPRAGQEDGEIEFTFKHYIPKELENFETEFKGKPLVDYLLKIVKGWSLDDEFNEANLGTLLQNYPASGSAIIKTYSRELFGVREKN